MFSFKFQNGIHLFSNFYMIFRKKIIVLKTSSVLDLYSEIFFYKFCFNLWLSIKKSHIYLHRRIKQQILLNTYKKCCIFWRYAYKSFYGLTNIPSTLCNSSCEM